MITKRIIPCLDVKDGRVVKGVNFEGLQDMADPVEMAHYYNESGADELVFYDITASVEGTNPLHRHSAQGGQPDLHPADGGRRHPHAGGLRSGAQVRRR